MPVMTINKLLSERPDIKGISLASMPLGSAGMTGLKTQPFIIYEFSKGDHKVYAVE